MLLTIGKQNADRELGLLRELLEILDGKLSEIKQQIELSADPDSAGLCDKGEYFIGIGFVAMQQYMTEALLFQGISKNDALNLGPAHASGATYASLINSAANWWKHEPEWVNQGRIPSNGTRTFDHIASVAPETGYELSNVLSSLCSNEEILLSSLVPYLVAWRDALINTKK